MQWCHQSIFSETEMYAYWLLDWQFGMNITDNLLCVFLHWSKYVFSPTITIVTKQLTVILTSPESDYERSMQQHDLWYDCLRKKLNFGTMSLFATCVPTILLTISLALEKKKQLGGMELAENVVP